MTQEIRCPKCGTMGSQMVLLSNPPKYRFKCSRCEYEFNSTKRENPNIPITQEEIDDYKLKETGVAVTGFERLTPDLKIHIDPKDLVEQFKNNNEIPLKRIEKEIKKFNGVLGIDVIPHLKFLSADNGEIEYYFDSLSIVLSIGQALKENGPYVDIIDLEVPVDKTTEVNYNILPPNEHIYFDYYSKELKDAIRSLYPSEDDYGERKTLECIKSI